MTLAFDRAHGNKIDNPLGSVTATKVIANDDYHGFYEADLQMAA